PAQRGLLVKDNKQVKCQPDQRAIRKRSLVTEQQTLAEDSRSHAHIHWISHVAIPARDDQTPCRQDRSRRSPSLQSKAGKRVEHDCPAKYDERGSEESQAGKPQQWRLKSPVRKPEGNDSGNESRSDKEEYKGAENSQARPHVRRQFTP